MSWHTDKKFILSLAALMFGNVWISATWAANKDATDKAQSEQIANLTSAVTAMTLTQNTSVVSLARIEENQKWTIDTLQQMRDQIRDIPTKKK